jgi:hypothetical protein
MATFGTETPEKLVELNAHLAVNNYVNGDLPGADDVRLFESLKSKDISYMCSSAR